MVVARSLRHRTQTRDGLLDHAAVIERAVCFNVRWSSDGSCIAAAMGGGQAKVYTKDGQLNFVTKKDDAATFFNVRWGGSLDTRSTFIIASATGTIEHWHMFEKKRLATVAENNQIFALDMAADGTTYATGGLDRTIRIYDQTASDLITRLEYNENTAGHQNRVFGLKYLPHNSNVLFSGGWDNMIHMWDLRTGVSMRAWSGPHITGDCIDFSHRHNTLLTGSAMPNDDNHPIQTWDIGTGRMISGISWFAFPGQTLEQVRISSCCFTKRESAPSEYIFAGSHERNDVRMYDSETQEMVGLFILPKANQRVFAIAASAASDEVAIACSDGSIYFVPFSQEEAQHSTPFSTSAGVSSPTDDQATPTDSPKEKEQLPIYKHFMAMHRSHQQQPQK